jgi:glyoxylase-like metal-dependent hydrolase (beta-lactamase superfamily II)
MLPKMPDPTTPVPDEVAPGIWRLTFPIQNFLAHVNAYLIEAGGGYALVDCGWDNDECWALLRSQMDALNLPVHAIHTVVATHGHPDHTGMARRLREERDVEVWMHASEQAFIDYRRDDSSAELLERWLLRYGMPAVEASEMAGRVREGDRTTPLVKPTHILQGGEEMRLGAYAFQVHWTPGHTPGHVCLHDPATQTLLCGDHVLQDVAPNVALQPYDDENPMPGYISSLEWLAELPVERTLPGHGVPFHDPRERARTLVGHQLRRQAQLRTMLTDQPQTTYQLAAQVWADAKPNAWPDFNPRIRRNAMGTLAAHLELLAERGEARRIDDGAVAYAAP